MDYKVITPAEYYANGEVLPQGTHPATYAHLQMMPQGAPAAYPFHPAEVYGLQSAGQPIRPPQPGSTAATTYFHPSQGYFEASNGNVASLPNATAYATGPIGQVPLQRRQPTGRPIGPAGMGIPQPQLQQKPPAQQQQQQQNPKRFDGAGDSEPEDQAPLQNEEDRSPDEIIQLLFNNSSSNNNNNNDREKEGLDKESNDLSQEAPNTATENPDDDLINSELDDDDDDDDNDDDDGNEEAGTMDENVVLCQYEKVSRTRNKWRCIFKSGLIHVNGVDYAFSRANGEFEW